jgi:type I restriction enzyme, R subunit
LQPWEQSLANEQKLMIMRPYQVYAVQLIVQCIKENSGNGYIWHATGSGKTLTSFKASTLLKENDRIHECVFVVDRKDLDRQTRDEFADAVSTRYWRPRPSMTPSNTSNC